MLPNAPPPCPGRSPPPAAVAARCSGVVAVEVVAVALADAAAAAAWLGKLSAESGPPARRRRAARRGRGRQPGARRDLRARRVEPAAAAADEHVVEQRRDLARVAVAQRDRPAGWCRRSPTGRAARSTGRRVLRYSGLRLTTRMAFMRATGWNLIMPWLRPASPESMIFSSSAIIGSGVPLRTGKMPTAWPRIQSTSKLAAMSSALRRSAPLPCRIRMLRAASGPHQPRLRREAVDQLDDGLRRRVAQRDHRDAVARLRRWRACRPAPVPIASPAGISR